MISLRARLQLVMMLILALTVAAVGLSFIKVGRSEIRRLSKANPGDLDAIARALEARLAANPGAPVAESLVLLGKEHATGLILAREARVLAAAPAALAGARGERKSDGSFVFHVGHGDGEISLAFRGSGTRVRLPDGEASLYPAPAAPPGGLDPLGRAILVVVLAAGIGGALLVFAVARRLTDPLEERTATSERLRREIVSDIAHELRAPLTNLRGELESIQDGVRAFDRARVDSLHSEVLALSALVDDLQELALADAGQMALEKVPLDLRAVAGRVAFASRASADAAGVVLALADGPPVPAEGDECRLAQVLRNLVQNALQHTPAGGAVTVSVRGESGRARVEVSDTGAGIPGDALPFVFERFYRVDKSRARATGGAGLGLAIAKKIIDAHGGTIGAASVAGRGSRLWFEIADAR